MDTTVIDSLRVRFFKKIQDWILKPERIRKRILRFFTEQINPRPFGSRSLKGAEESTPRVDSSVPLIHHDPRDLGLICSVKKRKIRFRFPNIYEKDVELFHYAIMYRDAYPSEYKSSNVSTIQSCT